MYFCPFLKSLSRATIHKEAHKILSFAPKCPFASRLFDKAQLSSLASSPTNETESTVCKDVSACLLKRCPYAFFQSPLVDENGSDSFVVSSDQDVTCNGIPTDSCSPIPILDQNGNPIPETCALFAGWKASRTARMETHTDITSPACGKLSQESASRPEPVTTFPYSDFFRTEVDKKKKDATYRVFRRVLRDAEKFPFADDYTTGKRLRVSIWCSNDYLGMSWHPKVQEAAVTAIGRHGVGSGGTRNISGNTLLHESLEAELADLHNKPSALLFTSCYVANEASLYTFGARVPQITILSDAGNHASMIHGIRTSRAPKLIYRHNDVNHLKELLNNLPFNAPKLVAFETVHSMTGDVCPLEELLDVTEASNALSFVDEVHAVGLYGARGAGVAERDGQMHRIDAISGTLGKAFASIGGYLAGSRELIDMIRSYASGFIFTTSLPPPTLAAARESVRILKSSEGQQLRAEHQRRVNIVRKQLQAEGLPVIEAPSHIIPLHVGEADLCTRISEELLREHRIYVQSINYPTVDKGDERLRIAPSPHHTDQLTDELVTALSVIWKKYDLPLLKTVEKKAVAA